MDAQGLIHDDGEMYEPEDFCGAIPRVGDALVSPRIMSRDLNTTVWGNRCVDIVEAVDFRPDRGKRYRDISAVCLVVRDRPMTEAEQGFL